jgi:hypothetical protein
MAQETGMERLENMYGKEADADPEVAKWREKYEVSVANSHVLQNLLTIVGDDRTAMSAKLQEFYDGAGESQAVKSLKNLENAYLDILDDIETEIADTESAGATDYDMWVEAREAWIVRRAETPTQVSVNVNSEADLRAVFLSMGVSEEVSAKAAAAVKAHFEKKSQK